MEAVSVAAVTACPDWKCGAARLRNRTTRSWSENSRPFCPLYDVRSSRRFARSAGSTEDVATYFAHVEENGCKGREWQIAAKVSQPQFRV